MLELAVFPLENKRKSMPMCWAQITQSLYTNKRQINFNSESKRLSLINQFNQLINSLLSVET